MSNEPNQNSNGDSPPRRLKRKFFKFLDSIYEFFYHLIDIRDGIDRVGTVSGIRNNVQLKGSNVWMLIASTFIASIGLDQNSAAVIIGAMLISPLMAPILGIGLSVGINDRSLLSLSLKDFGLAIAVSVITSTVYFLISPMGELTPEISARTTPTSLDVLIAFFGGTAGIVAQSRKDKSAAIPGVAIATALMPPLCVTGFGIAKGDFQIIFGAFYLFFLNSVFVALSTYLIVRFLGFRYKEFVDRRERATTRIFIIAFVLLIMIPSGYILYDLIEEDSQKQIANRFVRDNFNNEKYDAVRTSFIDMDSFHVLKIYLFGEYINEDSVQIFQDNLEAYGLKDTELKLIQSNLSLEERNELKNEFRKRESGYVEAIQMSKQMNEDRKSEVKRVKSQLDSLHADTIHFKSIKKELKALYPEIERLACGSAQITDFKIDQTASVIVFLDWPSNMYSSTRTKNEERIEEFLKVRYNMKEVSISDFPN